LKSKFLAIKLFKEKKVALGFEFLAIKLFELLIELDCKLVGDGIMDTSRS
jgi:hypothetical protein